ncbi:type II toxin-antitoxin system HicB family antitoxin [Methylibium sp. T29-B]|uniref:type II toxin-antitoxin system HicB family antitoxin n=2 Tax=unclassified Methylibium TaxID=2633235 RepID=UPI001E4DE0EA|nr:type II toxin-antitoxin system HicB family antitoxin [Methylibium sp. T29-B]
MKATMNPDKLTSKDLALTLVQKAYARRLIPDPEGGYTASIHELPGCFAEGETAEETLTALDAAAVAWIAAAVDSGHRIPEPIDASDHSGRIALRVPRTLHRMASERACTEGVSVNQLLVTAIATFLGQRDGLDMALSALRGEAEKCFYDVKWIRTSSGGLNRLIEAQMMKIANGSNAPGSLPVLMDISFPHTKALPALVNYG